MKKIFYFFSLITLCACNNNIPKFARDHIHIMHGTRDYEIVSDDTITIPIRRLSSLTYATAAAYSELNDEYAAAKTKKERALAVEKAEKAADQYYKAIIECGSLIDFPRHHTEWDIDQYRVIVTRANYRTIKTHIRVGSEEISTQADVAFDLFKDAYNSYDLLRSNILRKKHTK